MQSIRQNTGRAARIRITLFLKRSFFFALLYSSLLFILVRIFFYDFPFTVREAFELFLKILLVVWAFIASCKLVITTIVLLENNIDKMQFDRLTYLPALKKNILILLASALSVSSGTLHSNDHTKNTGTANNFKQEPVIDAGPVS
ncbi:MAG: hypothetical protein ABIS01_09500 [Ferruginibacter sp.]